MNTTEQEQQQKVPQSEPFRLPSTRDSQIPSFIKLSQIIMGNK